MNSNHSKNLLRNLLGITGAISASLWLSLPALALIQPEVLSGQSALENESLLSQSNGDSGDNGGDSDGSDNSASDDGGSDTGGSDDGGDNGSDSDNGSDGGDSSSSNGGDSGNGDSGEVFGTRGDNSNEGGAPYLGIGEPPGDNLPR